MNKEKYQWKENISSQEWDNILATLSGHPLQSASWGDSRKLIDGINDHRLAAFKEDKPIFLARLEERRFLGIFKIAWVPQGPTVSQSDNDLILQEEFFRRLRKKGFIVCVTNPWEKVETEKKIATRQTIWINLTFGKDKIWNSLSKQFRYEIRRAKKMGISIEKSNTQEDINEFYKLCETISNKKKFFLNGSASLMNQLQQNKISDSFESYLFKAQYNGQFCGGAFVIRLGNNVHYMWAATDRTFSGLNIGEAIQWEIIEWATSQNCKRYDLEGIDPVNNIGTYNFKKKLGGEIITLPSKQIYLLNNFIRAMIPRKYTSNENTLFNTMVP